MESIIILSRVIITILGIAFPILIQVISRLDDKYSSVVITEIFNREKIRDLFIILLITSILSVFLWVLNIPFAFQNSSLRFIFNDSANWFLFISSAALILVFFLFVQKVLIYYTPNKFVKYLINKHEYNVKKGHEKSNLYFIALSDILILSIRNERIHIAKSINEFMHLTFKRFRENNKEEYIVYPFEYYEITRKISQELAEISSKKFNFLERNSIGGIWLFGSTSNKKISVESYRYLWQNLTYAVEKGNDDLIILYWKNAHKHLTTHLRPIAFKLDKNGDEIYEKKREERDAERDTFLEFLYALGGLLLYQKRYNCIKRLFSYTTSIPPLYDLLPMSLNEIFELYFSIIDRNSHKYMWMSHKYPYPEAEGLNGDQLVKNWICKYLLILFIRQYFITPHLGYVKLLEPPPVPEKQTVKKDWIFGLDYMFLLMSKLLEESVMLDQLKFGLISKEWCELNEKKYPLDLITDYKDLISKSFESTNETNRVSNDKVENFNKISKKILDETFNAINELSNRRHIKSNEATWHLVGSQIIQSKGAYTENTDAHHLNHDSIHAQILRRRIYDEFEISFFQNRTISYVIQEDKIFSAINRLKLNKDEYAIIAMGINLEYFKNDLNIKKLDNKFYNKIQLHDFPYCNHNSIVNSIFVIRLIDLPKIITKDVDSEIINKFELLKISNKHKIYSSIIDLNLRRELADVFQSNQEDLNIYKSVLNMIAFSKEIRWKKRINLIQIKANSPFQNDAICDKLSDIKPFKE